MIANTAIPPTAPPTMGAMLVFFGLEVVDSIGIVVVGGFAGSPDVIICPGRSGAFFGLSMSPCAITK